MKLPGRTLIAVLAAVALLSGSAEAAIPAAAAQRPACIRQSSDNTDLTKVQEAFGATRPVVLVHGWDSNASPDMDSLSDGLDGWLNKPTKTVTLVRFDYSKASAHWASRPEVAACLADYLRQASKKYIEAGGDGKVLVVAHSMGGLATQFASDSKGEFTSESANDVIGGLVTLDTPFLGSYFGNQTVAHVAEALKNQDPQAKMLVPPPGSDASICLALHDQHTSLPKNCKYPPYLPATVPVTQIAGDIRIDRTLFGIELYNIDVGGDGIVSTESSQGYLQSGPPGKISPSFLRPRTEQCSMELGHVLEVGALAGITDAALSSAIRTVVGSVTYQPSLSTLLSLPVDWTYSGSPGQLLSSIDGVAFLHLVLAASALTGPSCSHTGITSHPQAIQDAAAALKIDMKDLSPVDWRNTSYTMNCGGLSHPFTVQLHDGKATVPGDSGAYTRYDVSVEAITKPGDLTADNKPETAVLLACSPEPSNFFVEDVQVFKPDGGLLAELPHAESLTPSNSPLPPQYDGSQLSISGRQLVAGMKFYAPTDSHASGPSISRTLTWHWDGHQFVTTPVTVISCQPGAPNAVVIGGVCLVTPLSYDLIHMPSGEIDGELCSMTSCPRFSIYGGSAYDGVLAGESGRPFSKDSPEGWETDGGAQFCMDAGEVTNSQLATSDSRPFGNTTAEFRQWSITCSTGATQMARAWILPSHKLLVLQPAADPRSGRDIDWMVNGATIQ